MMEATKEKFCALDTCCSEERAMQREKERILLY